MPPSHLSCFQGLFHCFGGEAEPSPSPGVEPPSPQRSRSDGTADCARCPSQVRGYDYPFLERPDRRKIAWLKVTSLKLLTVAIKRVLPTRGSLCSLPPPLGRKMRQCPSLSPAQCPWLHTPRMHACTAVHTIESKIRKGSMPTLLRSRLNLMPPALYARSVSS